MALVSNTDFSPKMRVSLDSNGLPKIIPPKLRAEMLQSRWLFVAVITILGIHRLVKWYPAVDLSTIIDSFAGETRTLTNPQLLWAKRNFLSLAKPHLSLKQLDGFRLRIGKVTSFILQSAGPNGSVSYFSVVEDAFAFYRHPVVLIQLSIWLVIHRGYLALVSLYLILFLGFPFYIILLLRAFVFMLTGGIIGKPKRGTRVKTPSPRFHLGRLGIVRTVSGKSRVVAMTNYWLQVAFRPLHDSIFELLRVVPTDGTFDQMSPLKRLVGPNAVWHLREGEKYFSYDLSAATDRLPIELQSQVLSSFTSPLIARLWKSLISVPFWYDGAYVKYAVGQPMGAYSSWAMLALTHHMVVNAAVTPHSTPAYAVLGDDVVVHSSISERYLKMMTSFGVEISLSKSIVSNRYIEFAKRLFSVDGSDFSCIGPGLILQAIHRSVLEPLVVGECLNRQLISIRETLDIIQNSSCERLVQGFGFWMLFGPKGVVHPNQAVDENFSKMTWLSGAHTLQGNTGFLLYNVFSTLMVKEYRSSVALAGQLFADFVPYLIRESVMKFGWILGSIYLPLLFLTPGPWLLLERIMAKAWEPFPTVTGSGYDRISCVINLTKALSPLKLEVMSHQDCDAAIKLFRELQIQTYREYDEFTSEYL